MPSVRAVDPTGDDYLDGIISGVAWNVSALTFSFPTASSQYGPNNGYSFNEHVTGFSASNDDQKAATRAIIIEIAEICNLTFEEVTESDSVHGDLRYANTTFYATANGHLPSTSSVGGDAWFNLDGFSAPLCGNYGYLGYLHEICHTIGLDHAHETGLGVVPADKDAFEYTVMSYRSYPEGPIGYLGETWGRPQSLMTLDILALQYIYGAPAAGSGNIAYHFNPTTGALSINGVERSAAGANRVFRTLPPKRTSGVVTLDLSDYTTNCVIDISPGGPNVISAGQLAAIGGTAPHDIAAANFYVPQAYAGTTDHLPTRVILGTGTDTVIGNSLTNTIVLSGNRTAYTVVHTGGGVYTVTGSPEEIKTISGIENIEFADGTHTVSSLSVKSFVAPLGLRLVDA